eukprot:jgi/Mesen1/351/ME000001S02660
MSESGDKFLEDVSDSDNVEFFKDLHVCYMIHVLNGLPSHYAGHESNRMTLAYFAVAGLDILDKLDQVDKGQVVDWIYSLQVLPSSLDDASVGYGFRGSPSGGAPFTLGGAPATPVDSGHLAATFSALAALRVLGDDFSRVHKGPLLQTMRSLQLPDGSFSPASVSMEADMRFVFCAAAISYMLEDWGGFDYCKALHFISRCQTFDGGFGLNPGLESHGGSTYCAVATLKLMGRLGRPPPPSPSPSRSRSSGTEDNNWQLNHLTLRQGEGDGGFHGRCNKPSDACYGFWIGATLEMLGHVDLIDRNKLRTFLCACQNPHIGGFSKWPNSYPDVLHSFYGLCGLCLLGEAFLQPLHAPLGISCRSAGLWARPSVEAVAGSNGVRAEALDLE